MNMQRKIKLCKRGINIHGGLPWRILPGRLRGFTLAEVMITVAIVAILASIAIPSYRNYIIKAARSEGKASLMDTAARMEQFYLDNKTYVATMTDLNASTTSEGGKYTISITASTATSYDLLATQVAGDDTDCGNLSLDSEGVKSASGSNTADCW